ncbi:MAG: hypothetical protein J0I41_00120 [Filimonas sp.]|nr:hypothetical protein [Filimonas sp.]
MYKIYLIDKTGDYVLLDTEDIDLSTTFSIADISDISQRKDSITKSIVLKGTETNNAAFGSLFHFNRTANPSTAEGLFFNFSPLTAMSSINCLVYEDGVLLLNGTIIVESITASEKGDISYNVVISGKLIGLKVALADKKLADIDLSDLQHEYNGQSIFDSWGGQNSANPSNSVGLSRTQRYNATTGSFYYEPFKLGSGYVYPFIDYGEKFQNPDSNNDYSNVKFQNYRPALWVREYLDRIFKDAGYTYEIRGEETFLERFNSLIVPNCEEKPQVTTTNNRAVYSNTFTLDAGYNRIMDNDNNLAFHPLPLTTQANTFLTNYSNAYGENFRDKNLLICNRTFSSDAKVKVVFAAITNIQPNNNATVTIQLVKRSYSTDDGDTRNWTLLAEQSFLLAKDEHRENVQIEFVCPSTQFSLGDQVQVRVQQTTEHYVFTHVFCVFNISYVSLEMTKDASTAYSMGVKPNDSITPIAPDGIKQYDFVKSIISMFNFFVFNSKESPRHFILERYDDYYALCQPSVIKSVALNWTNKIDYSIGWKSKSNLSIPKNYSFSYKDDNDYLNSQYKTKYSQSYGTLTFTDPLGITDSKKVEIVFSNSPQTEIGGTQRVNTMLVKDGTSLQQKNQTKVNCRILYYNGVHFTTPMNLCDDRVNVSTGQIDAETWAGTSWYCLASPYYFDKASRNSGTPKTSDGAPSAFHPLYSLNFSRPKEYYFNVNSEYENAITLYSENYINQISELTNINLFTLEVDVFLNEIDITSLDLRTPVFIDGGELGHAYFKVLSVEYSNNQQSSTVLLQKIVI